MSNASATEAVEATWYYLIKLECTKLQKFGKWEKNVNRLSTVYRPIWSIGCMKNLSVLENSSQESSWEKIIAFIMKNYFSVIFQDYYHDYNQNEIVSTINILCEMVNVQLKSYALIGSIVKISDYVIRSNVTHFECQS